MKKQQTGFTLIELAIVLVIIGLLLGGVLKGQDLINSAKAKNLIADFKNVQIFVYGYQDKFRVLPGDDNNPMSHLGVAQAATFAGDGDGVIEGAWDGGVNGTAPTTEAQIFWQHVRLSGLASGATSMTATNYYPTNSVNGRIGIQSLSDGFNTISNMTGTYVVCSASIPGKIAKQIDVNLDDGETSTGSVRAIGAAGTGTAGAGTTAFTSASLQDGSPYTVCMTF